MDADLVDPLELVLDGILDRDDVLVDVVELCERGVERGRLTRARRAGDEYGAVRLTERIFESPSLLTIHAEVVQASYGRGLIEDANRSALSLLCGKGGDAQVDPPFLHRDGDAAVLRNPLLGDVELAHDLDP